MKKLKTKIGMFIVGLLSIGAGTVAASIFNASVCCPKGAIEKEVPSDPNKYACYEGSKEVSGTGQNKSKCLSAGNTWCHVQVFSLPFKSAKVWCNSGSGDVQVNK